MTTEPSFCAITAAIGVVRLNVTDHLSVIDHAKLSKRGTMLHHDSLSPSRLSICSMTTRPLRCSVSLTKEERQRGSQKGGKAVQRNSGKALFCHDTSTTLKNAGSHFDPENLWALNATLGQ